MKKIILIVMGCMWNLVGCQHENANSARQNKLDHSVQNDESESRVDNSAAANMNVLELENEDFVILTESKDSEFK